MPGGKPAAVTANGRAGGSFHAALAEHTSQMRTQSMRLERATACGQPAYRVSVDIQLLAPAVFLCVRLRVPAVRCKRHCALSGVLFWSIQNRSVNNNKNKLTYRYLATVGQ